MSAPEIQMAAKLFRGRPQPDPDERLAQIKIFLADEDYHRTLKFTQRLAEIEEYIAFLEKNNYDVDRQLLKRIKEMIGAHKNWIKRATQAPSTSYIFTRYTHKNRLLGLVKDSKRRAELARVKAPKLSQNLIPGPALHKCMEKEDRPASPDPFLYTKQMGEIRRRQDAEAERILDMEQTAVLLEPIPTNFNGPYTPFYKMTYEDITEQRNILSETLKRLNDAAKLAPRPFIREIISIITHSIQDGADEAHADALEQFDSHLNNGDLQQLLILAEPSWNSDFKRVLQDLSDDGSPQSAMFAQLVELFKSDLWPEQNSVASLADVYKRVNAGAVGEGFPMTLGDIETFLVEMNEVGSIRYDINARTARKPLLDRHPEDRFDDDGLPPELYRTAAQKFGYTMAHLENILQDEDGNGDTSVLRNTTSIPSIKQQVETKFPLPITEPALLQPQDSSLTKEQAAGLLQKQIILEQNHNWDDRAPNFQRLWAFASSIENPKQFFALNRWPPELQSQERYNEIKQSGPAPPSPEQVIEQEFPRPKENEIFYPGETFFPFGETPYHEALQARQIDQNRPDAPIHYPPYSDPFALPELPETETPALMDYAAELGLGKRKRPVEDDTSSVNPHSGKTVRITNLTAARDATSVPAITTEAVAGSSYPTPEFTPETIGGVEMRVAESPAKGRRQVRFNTPGEGYGGGGVIGSSEGSSAMKRKVKATTEGGWFGPKLGGKGLGVGVKVRAPVEVRRQPAGVEVGRGGWRGRSL